jgi:hypothetical protein
MIMFVIILLILIVLIIYFKTTKIDNFSNVETFKVPPSMTKLKATESSVVTEINETGSNLLEKYADKLKSLANIVITVDDVNILQIPSFFNCNEKWPGCLPRPLYQGSCGSCWGFASVTCLSSRFYIESCGNSGCDNYPQINAGSLDDVTKNINNQYSFKKDYLETMAKAIDTDKNGFITGAEWTRSAEKFRTHMIDPKRTVYYRHMIAQILVFMLDFQSLGSIDLHDKAEVSKRAIKSFGVWKKENKINIEKLQTMWRKQPLNLSAEKLIACCTSCMESDFKSKQKKSVDNPVCGGGSLLDAWTLLRDTGTSTSLCIGYNLDNFKEGDKLTSCKELQGPYYSFCSGYRIGKYTDLQKSVDKLENSKIYPLAIPQNTDVPWVDPQLFRFRAKNAYSINNDVSEIQREIIERGPVNTGIYVYNDFQGYFGGKGAGGQKYTNGNPLGSSSSKLIYMKDPKTKEVPESGHAITLVGWGNFIYTEKEGKNKGKVYDIPYWTCLNSWGAEWGHSGFPAYKNRNSIPEKMKGGGYFWIVRGINNCGVEENVVCGQPNLENMSYQGVIDKYGWGLSSPSVNNKKIHFLPAVKLDEKTLSNDATLEISPALEAGGTFVEYIPGCKATDGGLWQVKSMKPPSPYLMFWPDDRPIYFICNTLGGISKTEIKIKIPEKGIKSIKIIKKISYNPILLLGEVGKQEQVQVLKIEDDNTLIVNRAVNYNKPLDHPIGTKVKIFPYENLNIDYLESNGFIKVKSK